jgi:hypothetical protein
LCLVNFRTAMDVKTNEFTEVPTPYEDGRVIVTPIPLSLDSPSIPSLTDESSTFSFRKSFSFPAVAMQGTEEETLAYKTNVVHEMFQMGIQDEDMDDATFLAQFDEHKKRRAALMNVNLPITQPTTTTMAYFIKNRDSPGKFDIEKAKALDIPVGKLYAQLKLGNSITLPALNKEGKMIERTIKSEDVLGPPVPGKTVLIIDIPRVEYVDKVLESESLNSEMVKNATVVVHMLADEVASNKQYIEWMNSFNKSTKVDFVVC